MAGTAVIVGVGPGLGVALANAFAQEGYSVLAAARNVTKSVTSPGDGRITPVDCDATDPDPLGIAQAYVALHRQQHSTWTQELDLRPWSEKF